jgi:hypothetical protein
MVPQALPADRWRWFPRLPPHPRPLPPASRSLPMQTPRRQPVLPNGRRSMISGRAPAGRRVRRWCLISPIDRRYPLPLHRSNPPNPCRRRLTPLLQPSPHRQRLLPPILRWQSRRRHPPRTRPRQSIPSPLPRPPKGLPRSRKRARPANPCPPLRAPRYRRLSCPPPRPLHLLKRPRPSLNNLRLRRPLSLSPRSSSMRSPRLLPPSPHLAPRSCRHPRMPRHPCP